MLTAAWLNQGIRGNGVDRVELGIPRSENLMEYIRVIPAAVCCVMAIYCAYKAEKSSPRMEMIWRERSMFWGIGGGVLGFGGALLP